MSSNPTEVTDDFLLCFWVVTEAGDVVRPTLRITMDRASRRIRAWQLSGDPLPLRTSCDVPPGRPRVVGPVEQFVRQLYRMLPALDAPPETPQSASMRLRSLIGTYNDLLDSVGASAWRQFAEVFAAPRRNPGQPSA